MWRGCRRDGLQGHASEDGNLTPGLIAMAQSWVEDVALPSFRGCGTRLPSLGSWFESPQVKLYLMVRTSAPFTEQAQHSCCPWPLACIVMSFCGVCQTLVGSGNECADLNSCTEGVCHI